MGFLDKAKEAAEQAASKAKEEAGELKAKREASHGYGELGRETYKLIQSGEVSHPSLTPIAERITEAEAAATGEAPVAKAAAAPVEPAVAPPEPAAPPAEPTA
jgi:hypothetical protein